MKRKRLRIGAPLVAAALALAACGGDDDDTAGSTDSASELSASATDPATTSADVSTPDPTDSVTSAPSSDTSATTATGESSAEPTETLPIVGVTDTEITVGGSYSAAVWQGAEIGAEARVRRLNESGGVHGRTIKFLGMKDDASDPTTSQDTTAELIQNDEVFAIVPVVTSLFNGFELAEETSTPYIGWGVGSADPWCNAEFGFPITGCLGGTTVQTETTTNYAAAISPALDGGVAGKTVAMLSDDNPSNEGGSGIIVGSYEAEGADVVYYERNVPAPPAVVSDFAPYVQALMQAADGAPPDIIELLFISPQTNIGVAQGLLAAGYEGDIVNYQLYDPRAAAVSGGITTWINFAPFEQDSDAMEQLVADVKAVDPDAVLSQMVLGGYWSMDVFIAMLEAAGPDLTKESFMAAASDFKYEVPGVFGPLEYPLNKANPVPCQAYVRGDGTGYEAVVPYVCTDPLPNPLFN